MLWKNFGVSNVLFQVLCKFLKILPHIGAFGVQCTYSKAGLDEKIMFLFQTAELGLFKSDRKNINSVAQNLEKLVSV